MASAQAAGFLGCFFGRGADGIDNALDLFAAIQMHQSRLDCATIGLGGILQPVLMGGGFGKAETPFTPKDTR